MFLKHFSDTHCLKKVLINHFTYHHFTGGGVSDSDVDILLHSDVPHVSEVVIGVICKLEHPTLMSHHDMIISKCKFPVSDQKEMLLPDSRLLSPPI